MVLDFIFALTVSAGFAIIFFAMSFTLSMVEMSQYVVFSSARAYSAANVSEEAQKELGQKKYAELRSAPMIKSILNSGWISLGEIQFGDFASEYPESSEGTSVFVGARLPFKANILNMRIPILGNTITDSGTGSANLNAYLLREVSTDECLRNFTSQRYEKFKSLDNRYSSLPSGGYSIITDNGC